MCTQLSYSRDVLEITPPPLDGEFHSARDIFSSPEQNSLSFLHSQLEEWQNWASNDQEADENNT